jgi:DNA polymerase-3 subunit gamma/tau
MAEHTPNFADVLQQILIVLHHASLAQWVPEAIRREDDADRILDLARRISAEDLQLFYQIGLIGQRDLPLAPDPRSGFEMVMLRMLAFRPATSSADMQSGVDATPPKTNESPKTTRKVDVRPTPAPVQTDPVPVKNETKTDTGGVPQTGAPHDWHELIRAMGITGLTRELANNCVLLDLDEKRCILALDPQHAHLRVSRVEANLEKALRDYFRSPLKLTIKIEAPGQETPAKLIQREKEERQRNAEIEIEQDENVRALKERFDARIVPGSTKPID